MLLLTALACLTRTWTPESVPLGDPERIPDAPPRATCEAEIAEEQRDGVLLDVRVESVQSYALMQDSRADQVATWESDDKGYQWMIYSGIGVLSGGVLFLGDPDAPVYEPIAPGMGASLIGCGLCGVGIGGAMEILDDRPAGRRRGETTRASVRNVIDTAVVAAEPVSVQVDGESRGSGVTAADGVARIQASVALEDQHLQVSTPSGAECLVEVRGTKAQRLARKARIQAALDEGDLEAAVAALPPADWDAEIADELWSPIEAVAAARIEDALDRDDPVAAAAALAVVPQERQAGLRAPVSSAMRALCTDAKQDAASAWLDLALSMDAKATAATSSLPAAADSLDRITASVGSQITRQVEAGIRAGKCQRHPAYGITFQGVMYDEDCSVLRDLDTLDELLGDAYRAARHGKVAWHFAKAAQACDASTHGRGPESTCQALWSELRSMEYGIESGSGSGLVSIALGASSSVVEELDGWRPDGLKLSLGKLASAAATLQSRAERASAVYELVEAAWSGHEQVSAGRDPGWALERLEEDMGGSTVDRLGRRTQEMIAACER